MVLSTCCQPPPWPDGASSPSSLSAPGRKAFSNHLSNHSISPAQIRHVIQQMEALNQEIEKDEANLGKGYRIGHSFFTPIAPVPDFQKWFQSIVRYEIMPLLEEYWIDDPKMCDDNYTYPLTTIKITH